MKGFCVYFKREGKWDIIILNYLCLPPPTLPYPCLFHKASSICNPFSLLRNHPNLHGFSFFRIINFFLLPSCSSCFALLLRTNGFIGKMTLSLYLPICVASNYY
uniref:Uncharacterized protein n=1 Tax=Cacopsylla melanoneura TaxID=428564 RepID=A0A8D8R2D5_9HEMI